MLNRFFSKGGLKSDDVIRIESPTYTAAKGSTEYATATQDIPFANANNYVWNVTVWNVISSYNTYIKSIYTDSTKIRINYYYKELSTTAVDYKFELIGIKKN